MKYEVKHDGNMGMGQLWLIMGGHLWLNGEGIYDLDGWGSYDKVSCSFIWKYAQKMLVFSGVPFPIIA